MIRKVMVLAIARLIANPPGAAAGTWTSRRPGEGAGLDGVVAKPLGLPYSPDKRVMFKIKHERTADCVLAGFRWHKSGPIVGSLIRAVCRPKTALRSSAARVAARSAAGDTPPSVKYP